MSVQAFDRYLLSLPRAEARAHFIECLVEGGELAFQRMDATHGPGWSIAPESLADLVDAFLSELHEYVRSEAVT